MDGVMTGAVRITSTPAPGFEGHFRLGQFWPAAGRTVAADALTPEEWAVLAADTRLHIGPAQDAAEIEGAAEAALRGRIRDVLPLLEPADFGKTGVPKVAALERLLPGDAKAITGALVADVWADVKAGP
jgi:hypothetical protein